MPAFACIVDGRERWHANARAPLHRHDQAYAAVILCGCYEECGSLGRFRVGPGNVLLHGRYEAHLDRFGMNGAHILNIAIQHPDPPPWSIGRIEDADAVARTAETDPAAAYVQLCEKIIGVAQPLCDWPDLLAADLLRSPRLRLGDWAHAHGLAPETISRGFRKVFGFTPAGFRAESRTRFALSQLAERNEPLAAIADRAGFADQAHMSRATKALTGDTPGRWRTKSNPFKTAAVRPR